MSFPPFVMIVTVNYNGSENTLETLTSLAQMSYPCFEILLVDNGSSDDSLATIRRAFPALSVIANKTNIGFAGGFNLGLQRSIDQGADLIFVVNNDIVVAPDMLDSLVGAWGPGVGAVAPCIYYYDQPDVIWSSGFRRHPITLEMVGGQRNRMAHVVPQFVPFPVDYLLGCALLLDRDALVASGLFDPQFYLYYEDLDLSVRLQQQGYRLLTVPAAKMWHKVAGSSGLDSPLRTYHLARSSVLFFRKHGGSWRTPFVLADRIGSAIRKVGTFLSRGDHRAVHAYLHGLRDGWRGKCNDTPYR